VRLPYHFRVPTKSGGLIILLAEAMQERCFLKDQLEVLESRLSADSGSQVSMEHLATEIGSTSNRLRDIEVAIDWTVNHAMVSNLPLSAYRTRGKLLHRLSKSYELVDRKAADDIRRKAHTDSSLAVKATWFVELQIPPVGEDDEPEEK
jgi:hypothetical protein